MHLACHTRCIGVVRPGKSKTGCFGVVRPGKSKTGCIGVVRPGKTKTGCSATETNRNLEIFQVSTTGIILA